MKERTAKRIKRSIGTVMTITIMLSGPVYVPAEETELDITEEVTEIQTDDLSTEMQDLSDIGSEMSVTDVTDTGPENGITAMSSPEENSLENAEEGKADISTVKNKLPSKYNLYKEGKLPPVRNQDPYQTCWAFAVIGAMESDLIADGKGKKNLSETQLAYYVTNKYKDPKNCRKDTVSSKGSYRPWIDNGGKAYQGLHVLSNLIGAVRESDAPYSKAKKFHPDSSFITSKDYAQLRSASYISTGDRNGIKRAIMEHGGVIASYYDDSKKYYDEDHKSYYCRVKDVNHTVMIVGWNDGFSKNRFRKAPKGNGAWLVRNSRGYNGYDKHGYFWMSYYDLSFKYSGEVIAVDADRNRYDNCYAYDGQPVKDVIRYAKSTDTVEVSYKVGANEIIKGVGFEIRTDDVNTSVTVTNKKTGESVTGKLYTKYGGFYTIKPDKPLKIGKKAEVTVRLNFNQSKGEKVAIVCEKEGSFVFGRGDYRYKGVCDKGFRIGNKTKKNDPRIKLYTNNSKAKKK